MKHRIEIVNGSESFGCPADLDVLRAMECLGRKGIPVGCRGGGCGICKVRVVEGPYRTGAMSRACVSVDEQSDGYALACKLFAEGDLRLQVVGKMARCFAGSAGGFHVYGLQGAASQTNN
ncbi:2Fe-2S iron-sulfur cluster protein [Panacagrimonas perspica]|uniref:2Fe-2S iron-sulfur cluster protein n=1 Tax=Panacagrimonas perspica TaxID=381431 RepID=A0A4R7PEF9_9GAMM|nr:2Fe-2S iron-sulfur cluster-binding protein [Panacagrimonas perspica]TDU32595.1 2Fe-2S iron-sulfur cluster protein [Panacagrimonas perspica]